jgi:HK97 family phage prohead protease
MIVTKALVAVESVEDSAEFPNGGFELILSDPSEDRDGETVEPGAFNPLPDHIAMDIDHGMSVATTVGSGIPTYNDAGQLVVRGGFASTSLAQDTRALVREGHVRTASVAMIVKTKTKAAGGGNRITKAELLNGAFTPVPSNTNARILSSKSLEGAEMLMKEGKRNSSTDQDNLQAAHDALVALGADCVGMKHQHGGEIATKAEDAADADLSGDAPAGNEDREGKSVKPDLTGSAAGDADLDAINLRLRAASIAALAAAI